MTKYVDVSELTKLTKYVDIVRELEAALHSLRELNYDPEDFTVFIQWGDGKAYIVIEVEEDEEAQT